MCRAEYTPAITQSLNCSITTAVIFNAFRYFFRLRIFAGTAGAAGSGPGAQDLWKLLGYGYQMER
jgi:hypothetical protein